MRQLNQHHIDLSDFELTSPEDNFYALQTNQREQRADRVMYGRASQKAKTKQPRGGIELGL